jgi:hypothetical protein
MELDLCRDHIDESTRAKTIIFFKVTHAKKIHKVELLQK